MVIERHRVDVQFDCQLAHGQALHAARIDEAQSCRIDLVRGKRCAPMRAHSHTPYASDRHTVYAGDCERSPASGDKELSMTATRSIPALRGVPFLGNALQLSGDVPTEFLVEAADKHPEGIYRVDILGRQALFVYDPDLVDEVCDETRFYKSVAPPLSIVRDFAGDGLFTARGNEPVWGQAHRILMPAFGQRSMKTYFPQMLEVAEALATSWAARQSEDLAVADDMTRLTLDTIALTGFGYRFDSFSSPQLHPFLQAMGNALTEAMVRARQPLMVTRMRARREEAYRADIHAMQELVDDVIHQRRGHGHDGGTDLLGLMLEAADPRTGDPLPDENIRNQVLTFLIAGHETTSGLLSFALYNLLRNPHVLAQAYREVDRFLPDGSVPSYETIMKLDVIPRVLEETLRIWSPIPGSSSSLSPIPRSGNTVSSRVNRSSCCCPPCIGTPRRGTAPTNSTSTDGSPSAGASTIVPGTNRSETVNVPASGASSPSPKRAWPSR